MIEVIGSLPESFLKAYKECENAEKLVRHGEIYLGHLMSYREMEASQKKDPSEGESRFLSW